MSNPIYLRSCVVAVSDDDTRRVLQLIIRLGSIKKATATLGVGEATFDAARGGGRMMQSTLTRLRAALDRVEGRAAEAS